MTNLQSFFFRNTSNLISYLFYLFMLVDWLMDWFESDVTCSQVWYIFIYCHCITYIINLINKLIMFAILIPSEFATSVFFSHNLCNNSRANYLLFFGKFSNPLRKLISTECKHFMQCKQCKQNIVCDCRQYFFHNAFACVFLPTWTTVDTLTVHIFDMFASQQRNKNNNNTNNKIKSQIT